MNNFKKILNLLEVKNKYYNGFKDGDFIEIVGDILIKGINPGFFRVIVDENKGAYWLVPSTKTGKWTGQLLKKKGVFFYQIRPSENKFDLNRVDLIKRMGTDDMKGVNLSYYKRTPI